jgi:hypothetical protein
MMRETQSRRSRIARSIATLTAAVALTWGMGGCNNAMQGGASGAGMGALVGMGIGSLSGNMGKGAAAGAMLGALGGAILGDQNARSGRSLDY